MVDGNYSSAGKFRKSVESFLNRVTVSPPCLFIARARADIVARLAEDACSEVPLPADYDRWLDVQTFDRDALQTLLRPYPAERLAAYPVSPRVNSPKNDDELCSMPVGVGAS